jgi:hypothetical protein
MPPSAPPRLGHTAISARAAARVAELAARSEQLARLAYELLDAHFDTVRLVDERSSELEWRAHLRYLRDLQRCGREILAQGMAPANRIDGETAVGTGDA